MPAFGSSSWPYNYGVVASINKDSVTMITGTGATEGTNQLTYACDLTGIYKVTSLVRIRTAGTGASQAVKSQVAHNNGSVIAAADIAMSGVAGAITALDLTGAAGTFIVQSGVYKCVSGTNVVVSLLGSGTFTTAAIGDVYVSVERIG
jgi:hypothetical protein